MQKLCCVRTRQHLLPVWSHKFVLSSTTHISTNSRPFLVGIVSLTNFPHGPLRVRTHEPDYSIAPHKVFNLQRTICSGVKEEVTHDTSEPEWKHVTKSTYVHANLHHNQVTGSAVTACPHHVNATPSHWHTKRQATVETATLGSEIVAAGCYSPNC